MVCYLAFCIFLILFLRSLTFVYLPPSHNYGYQSIELIPNGSHIVRYKNKNCEAELFCLT
jgi:hypothetical protein